MRFLFGDTAEPDLIFYLHEYYIIYDSQWQDNVPVFCVNRFCIFGLFELILIKFRGTCVGNLPPLFPNPTGHMNQSI